MDSLERECKYVGGCCKIRCPISKISTSLGDLVLAALSIFCSNLQHFHLKFSTSLRNFQNKKWQINFCSGHFFFEAAVWVRRSLLSFLLSKRRFSRRFFSTIKLKTKAQKGQVYFSRICVSENVEISNVTAELWAILVRMETIKILEKSIFQFHNLRFHLKWKMSNLIKNTSAALALVKGVPNLFTFTLECYSICAKCVILTNLKYWKNGKSHKCPRFTCQRFECQWQKWHRFQCPKFHCHGFQSHRSQCHRFYLLSVTCFICVQKGNDPFTEKTSWSLENVALNIKTTFLTVAPCWLCNVQCPEEFLESKVCWKMCSQNSDEKFADFSTFQTFLGLFLRTNGKTTQHLKTFPIAWIMYPSK